MRLYDRVSRKNPGEFGRFYVSAESGAYDCTAPIFQEQAPEPGRDGSRMVMWVANQGIKAINFRPHDFSRHDSESDRLDDSDSARNDS
jgi:hypothetical protein